MQPKNTQESENLFRAPVHSDVGAILCDSAELLLPLTSPCCDHKTPSSPQGSVQRSPRILLVLVEAPPLDPGVSGDGRV